MPRTKPFPKSPEPLVVRNATLDDVPAIKDLVGGLTRIRACPVTARG